MKRLIAVALLISSSALAEDFAKDAMPQYFPISTNRNPVNAVKPFCSEWFSLHLHMMQEPSLFEATNRTDLAIYRFTELPSWGRPLAVRAVVATNQVYVRTVILILTRFFGHVMRSDFMFIRQGSSRSQAVSSSRWRCAA